MSKGIDLEEGYHLVREYVNYYYRERYYSLKRDYEIEDIVHEVYLTLRRRKYFSKYDSKKGAKSKKFYIALAVKRCMIDMLKTQKEKCYSLEKELEDRPKLKNRIIAEEVIEDVQKQTSILNIIKELKNNKTRKGIKGITPLLGECELSKYSVGVHLAYGYEPKEIAEFFESPKESCNHISNSTIYNIKDEIKNIFKEEGYIFNS